MLNPRVHLAADAGPSPPQRGKAELTRRRIAAHIWLDARGGRGAAFFAMPDTLPLVLSGGSISATPGAGGTSLSYVRGQDIPGVHCIINVGQGTSWSQHAGKAGASR
jgi:hypothetical protein